ncbi:MAG: hypothetical protein WC530_02180 [Candidatus Omnitrophota bacterium]|jgi:hypothetical protein
MRAISPSTFKSPVYRVYAHLSDEERLDQACALLAEGVLRLAEKRGLLKGQKAPAPQASETAKETF